MTESATHPAPDRPAVVPPADRSVFDAFISYSHAADGRLAPRLQDGLQRLARPLFRPRALRVFRDETGLAATPALWPSIQRALDDARFFILLASPDAAASEWVVREIQHWLAGPPTARGRPADRLFIVLTHGDIHWDDAAGGFDSARSSALPACLHQGVFGAEPLWVDLRGARSHDDLSLQNPYFRGKVADLAAPIHGRAKDELVGEDLRIARRARRLAWAASLLLALLAVTATATAYWALVQRDQARSREQAAAAVALLDIDPRESLRRAVGAVATARTSDAVSALRESLLRSALRAELVPDSGRIAWGTFAPRGDRVLTRVRTGEGRGYLQLWDGVSGRPLCAVPGALEGRFTADGTGVVTGDGRRVDAATCLPAPGDTAATPETALAVAGFPLQEQEIVDPRTGAVLLRVPGDVDPVGGAVRGADPGWIVTWAAKDRYVESGGGPTEIGELAPRVWALRDGSRWSLPGHRRAVNMAVFGPADATVVSGSDDRTVRAWSVEGGELAVLRGHAAAVEAVAVSADGGRILSVAADGTARLWEPGTGLPVPLSPAALFRLRYGIDLPRLQGPDTARGVPVLSRDGRRVLAPVDALRVAAWDAATGLRLGPLLVPDRPSLPLWGLAGGLAGRVSPDGTRLLVPLGDPAVTAGEAVTLVLDVGTGQVVDSLSAADDSYLHTAAYSPDGTRIATAGEGGVVRLWNAATGAPDTVLRLDGTRVLHVAFSHDGTRLAISSRDALVRLWEPRTGRVTELFGHEGGVLHAFFSPDDALVVSISQDDGARVWDAATGKMLRRFTGSHAEPAFLSADCGVLVTGAGSDEGEPPRGYLHPFGACGPLEGMMALARRRT